MDPNIKLQLLKEQFMGGEYDSLSLQGFFFCIIVSMSLSICYFIVIFSPRLHFMQKIE